MVFIFLIQSITTTNMIHLAIGIIIAIGIGACIIIGCISVKIYEKCCKRCTDEVLNRSLIDYLYEN